jgi:putative transcriptional regulator
VVVVVLGAAPAAAWAASLAGRLLVATEEMGDPRFARTVILMIQHDASGAMGLVINREAGRVPVAALLHDLGVDATGTSGEVRVYLGGPVEPGRAFVLHTPDYAADGTQTIGGVAVTAQPEILQAIGRGAGPKQFLFLLGYAGWAPGQLEAEMRSGHWVDVPADDRIIFDQRAETKWERALARRTTVL